VERPQFDRPQVERPRVERPDVATPRVETRRVETPDVPRTARTDGDPDRVRPENTTPRRTDADNRPRVTDDQTERPRIDSDRPATDRTNPGRIDADRTTRDRVDTDRAAADRTAENRATREARNIGDRLTRQFDRAEREVQDNLRQALGRSTNRDGRDRDGRDRDGRDRDGDIVRDGNRFRDFDNRFRDDIRRWEDRGDRIRSNYRRGDYFTTSWWRGRPVIGFDAGGRYGIGGRGYWGYQPWLGYQPYGYWWGRPSWLSLIGWFGGWGGYGGYGWGDPFYYDYGPGGNVVYTRDYVVVNGQNVGTPASFYAAARALATVDMSQVDPNDRDWQPLGTFSMAVRQDEVDPPRVVQLATNKDGIISGTVFNRESGNLYNVQGRVDPETQRVAFTLGNDRNTVFETGLYNLTQDQTPVLVHFSARQHDTYVLARLPEPSEAELDRAAAQPEREVAR
jgi:hypothetical protein